MAEKSKKAPENEKSVVGEVLIIPITKEHSKKDLHKILGIRAMACDDCDDIGTVWCNGDVPGGHTHRRITYYD